ncbi:MAG: hypothetical protein R6W90_13340 [Ignavibacteriaceae bacterium]
MLNGTIVSEDAELKEGETITANDNSGFKLDISAIGEIQASENTSVKRTSDSSLQLIRGYLYISKDDDSDLLTVELTSANISDVYPGGEYEIQFIPGFYTLMKNKSGWIKIYAGKTEFYLLSGYECEINESGAGIPYHHRSSEVVKKLLHQYIFSSEDRDDLVDRLIILTENRDLVSLWNILKIASPMKRGDIYDYFAKLIFMPPSITKEGIIYLKKEMMMSLLAELEPALEI